ncbi:Metallo-hydrolase/oxidoreductase [Neurospora crassa]|uniref:Metallo-beta-lactamase superfamily protein n=1 Tax=Neurospora crassa (strain ATCC 24698 / 74-OR23-1A / CBS 708.71 / DSM 1257 / FGSC 987) TaxID=367110 RepID=Q7S992_NEUCR|nr:metallo-beta-lactamase superfamily protein [Neurospora crassa OR74A]EAA32947.2 metallo-beta-lactamase superfamily protein [Neurospora crassa OR74A]KHE80962.1 Metallo-hydrolase/oxidoreductase [Neurospora crassa]|eukprot:XP_962183.2 metallo-beta-lactamase superfamily protein [Neurospora crassa OR74A]
MSSPTPQDHEPLIHPLFDPTTSTFTYLVACPSTLHAVVIDSVLDFDPATARISTTTADSLLLSLIRSHNYKIVKILETHVHADHLTASRYLQTQLASDDDDEEEDEKNGGTKKPEICIGKRIVQVQKRVAESYGLPREEWEGVFDRVFEDDEEFRVGDLKVKVKHLPGHTPDHVGYMVGSNIFCGDSLFDPEIGSARCDFPGGDAHALYNSVQTLFSLPAHYRIYTGHDYPSADSRSPQPYTTVADQKRLNKHLKEGTTKDQFVTWRQERDSGLAEPKLLHQALQVNVRAGRMPKNGMLKVPLKMPGGWKL